MANERPPMLGIHVDDELMARIDNEVARRIKAGAPRTDRSRAAVARNAIEEYLQKAELTA